MRARCGSAAASVAKPSSSLRWRRKHRISRELMPKRARASAQGRGLGSALLAADPTDPPETQRELKRRLRQAGEKASRGESGEGDDGGDGSGG